MSQLKLVNKFGNLNSVNINISVWNFGFGPGLGVNTFEVGRFIPVTCLGPLLTVTWLRLCALEVKIWSCVGEEETQAQRARARRDK